MSGRTTLVIEMAVHDIDILRANRRRCHARARRDLHDRAAGS